MSNLIIEDSLVNPPTDILAFRHITLFAHCNLNMDVLIQTTQEFKDIYYKWMLQKGLMDYIEYLLAEFEKEDGLKLSTKKENCKTIKLESIKFENLIEIIGKISILK